MSKKWIVSWEIDIETDTAVDPLTAAKDALSYVQGYKTPVLIVVNKETQEKWEVDLEKTKKKAVTKINNDQN